MDHDGDSDIVVGHKTPWLGTNPTITLMKNHGKGHFIISDTTKSYSGYQENIFACNIDDNGSQDIVTFYSDFSTGNADRNLRIWFNENGVFHEYADFSLYSSAIFSSINYGDINGDNYTDILVLSNNAQLWGILYNNGNGTLSIPEYFNVPNYYPLDIDCGDLNGDGREDVAVCGQDMEVYYSFQAGFQKITFPGAQKSMLDIIDFNADGYLDLVTAADFSLINITSLVIYRHQADTNLEELPEVYFSPGSIDFCINDFNNDELPDVAFLSYFPYTGGSDVQDTVGGIYILYNLGAFQVGAPEFISLKNYSELYRNFHSSDLDGNGCNDLAIVRTFYDNAPGTLEILFNDGEGNFIETPFDFISSKDLEGTLNFSAYPNPFNERISVQFELNQESDIVLSVCDLDGISQVCVEKVNLLKGEYSFTWDSNNSKGILCKPGIYLVTLKSNKSIVHSIKLIKLN